MTRLKVGFLGTGNIAGCVAKALQAVPEIELYAAASRTQERAESFSKEYDFEVFYPNYEELIADSKVDLVYIATPHSHHALYMKMCISAGKNTLCEKAFTLNSKETEEVIKLAGEKKVYLCEAIRPRFVALAESIKEIITSGKIGKPVSLTANLGYDVWARDRVHSRDLGGGALLDVGIYPLHFLDLIDSSDIKELKVSGELDPRYDTDMYETVHIVKESGLAATIFSSCVSQTDRQAVVYGTKGYMVVDNVNIIERVRVYDNSRSGVPFIDLVGDKSINGFEGEFLAAKACIEKGELESLKSPLSQTLRLMKQMDAIRKELGVVYPVDEQ